MTLTIDFCLDIPDGDCCHLSHTWGEDMAEIFKPLGVSLGVKSRVKAVTLFLTPPFRPTPNEAKGGRPYLVAKAVKV